MLQTYHHIHHLLTTLADPEEAQLSKRFFKTGPGQYSENDIFLGISVPQIRSIAKQFRELPNTEIITLLKSCLHEERLLGLIIMSDRCKKSKLPDSEQNELYTLYMTNLEHVNNWNLVDTSAPYIVGKYLIDKDSSILTTLAQSDNIWHRRIAIISTQYFIKQGIYEPTLQLAKILIADTHDLIHKAVGWMLRELGQQNPNLLRSFLDAHIPSMPRTMLRYAIEKFPQSERLDYLQRPQTKSHL